LNDGASLELAHRAKETSDRPQLSRLAVELSKLRRLVTVPHEEQEATPQYHDGRRRHPDEEKLADGLLDLVIRRLDAFTHQILPVRPS
jgi:hypothetical protein